MTISIFDTALTIGEGIATGLTTSVDICQAYIDQINAKNPLVSALVHRRGDAAILADAAASDARTACGKRRGPLDGVPFNLKAVLEAEGTRTTTGTTVVDYYPVAGRNSDIAVLLRDAGCILIGKANAPGGPVFTEPGNQPRCKNPYNTGRATGGSSGGSAVAVAAGMGAFDVGTDAAGSVRLPASWCGVYGLKPTIGTISGVGDIWPVTRDRPPVHRDLCVPGPLARSLDDLEALLGVLNQPTRGAPNVRPISPADPKSLQKVVIIDKIGTLYCDATVQAAIETLATNLAAAGVTVVRKPAFPMSEARFVASYDGIRAVPDQILISKYPTINPHASGWVNNNVWIDTSHYFGLHCSALIEARKLLDTFTDWHDDADVVLMPTHPVQAPTFGTAVPNTFTYLGYSSLANIIDVPAVNIPLGAHSTGTPFGLQVIGRPYRDYDLLHFAKQVDAYCIGYTPPVL